jgi:hypothetical protein
MLFLQPHIIPPIAPSVSTPCYPSVPMLKFNINCSIGDITGHNICGWSNLPGSGLILSVLHF